MQKKWRFCGKIGVYTYKFTNPFGFSCSVNDVVVVDVVVNPENYNFILLTGFCIKSNIKTQNWL